MPLMARIIVPAAEELLDKEISVLDHGFVRLVDYMGGDARIVQAARVSYGDGTKTVREDGALIDYLIVAYGGDPVAALKDARDSKMWGRMPKEAASPMLQANLDLQARRQSE